MRKLFTIALIMMAAIVLLAGPVAAQSGSTPPDKEKLMKLKEFVGRDPKANSQQSNDKPASPSVPAQATTKPVQPPAKPAVQTPSKGQATFVGKVSDKMSPERKACTDKCEAAQASCEARCKNSVKTDDIALKNECVQCRNTIISCLNRCPAK